MPPVDPATALAEATRRRSQHAREQAEQAITAASRTRNQVSVAGIATTAGVSRSWLYTQPDLITAIRALRGRQPTAERTGPQPASTASLQTRLDAALARIKQLRADNGDLTRQLETAFGEIRRLRNQAPPQT